MMRRSRTLVILTIQNLIDIRPSKFVSLKGTAAKEDYSRSKAIGIFWYSPSISRIPFILRTGVILGARGICMSL